MYGRQLPKSNHSGVSDNRILFNIPLFQHDASCLINGVESNVIKWVARHVTHDVLIGLGNVGYSQVGFYSWGSDQWLLVNNCEGGFNGKIVKISHFHNEFCWINSKMVNAKFETIQHFSSPNTVGSFYICILSIKKTIIDGKVVYWYKKQLKPLSKTNRQACIGLEVTNLEKTGFPTSLIDKATCEYYVKEGSK